MTGWCPYKTGTLEEQECHFDGYCSECPHNKSDLISRQKAIDATWERPTYADPLNVLTEVRDRIKALPSAQPEQRWIPFQFRPMTEEEKAEFVLWDIGEEEEMVCGEVPDDGQEILVSWNGHVWLDSFERDEGVYLDNHGEIEHGMAWQPLPEPYKEDEKNDSSIMGHSSS